MDAKKYRFLIILVSIIISQCTNVIAQVSKEQFIVKYATDIAKVIHPTSKITGGTVKENSRGNVNVTFGLTTSDGKYLETICLIDFSNAYLINVVVVEDDDCCSFMACNASKFVLQEAIKDYYSEREINQFEQLLGKGFEMLACDDLLGIYLQCKWRSYRGY
jgi:hypothetical protein